MFIHSYYTKHFVINSKNYEKGFSKYLSGFYCLHSDIIVTIDTVIMWQITLFLGERPALSKLTHKKNLTNGVMWKKRLAGHLLEVAPELRSESLEEGSCGMIRGRSILCINYIKKGWLEIYVAFWSDRKKGQNGRA